MASDGSGKGKQKMMIQLIDGPLWQFVENMGKQQSACENCTFFVQILESTT